MAEDYCEHCDLPLSTCVHGNPPAPEPVKAPPKASPVTRKRVATPRAAKETAAVRTAPRRRTDKAEFKPVIVQVLQEHGGEREADLVLAELEERPAPPARSAGAPPPAGPARSSPTTACCSPPSPVSGRSPTRA